MIGNKTALKRVFAACCVTLGTAGMTGCASMSSASAEALLIRDADIFDVTDGSVHEGDVLVIDGRFSAVEDTITKYPSGTRIIDADGLGLLPGLIDVHTHWTGMNGADRASIASDLLKAGVTTATDFHSAPESFESKRAYHKTIQSPHVFYAARIGVPYGHGTEWGDEHITKVIFSAREGQAAVESLLPYKPDAIKVFADGWRYGGVVNLTSINEDALEAVVDTASAAGLPVFSHTVTVEGGKIAAEGGVTAIVHAIQDADADEELVSLMQEHDVLYSPTLTVYEPFEHELAEMSKVSAAMVLYRQERSRANMRTFLDAGIRVALGTDQGIDNNPFGEADLRELELMVDFGLTPAEALQAATRNSAAVLKLEEDRGSIEAGKRADFILVDGHPWDSISEIRNVKHVFVDGVQVVADGQLTKPQGSGRPSATPAQSVIDDFEADDLTTKYGARRFKTYDAGLPRSEVMLGRVERIGGGKALHMSAMMALKDDPFAFATLPLSPGEFVPVDASAFTGVRFEARGSDTYDIILSSTSGEGEHSFVAGPEWKTVEISFASLQGEDGAPLNVSELLDVSFGMHAQADQSVWLEIDNVEFY